MTVTHSSAVLRLFADLMSIAFQFYNWNKVYFRYCDGGSYSGDVADPVNTPNGEVIYFRGKRIVEAYMDTLRRLHGVSTR